ncbi:hypothetical protein BCR33DRAFT_715570 [Rhizoclosmatium globosum]|uniref:PH domain-containing protein n=1 Tax=Rhizoclosmatium globosum TaxID=329046 RepID=A0A1Y2CHI4_9FUNG|nr:hypothetical protein BCR33DRAFT_715570 [Rhizoclosmatium globosum]|eukprot:ORY46511.1 hypothetical protein BCR33DRAFT_715570 [Rhizoclosmatium globosum]
MDAIDALLRDLDSSLDTVNVKASRHSKTVSDLLSDTSALSGFLHFAAEADATSEVLWLRRFFVLSKDRLCHHSATVLADVPWTNNPLAFEVVDETIGKSWMYVLNRNVEFETWIDMIYLLISRAPAMSPRIPRRVHTNETLQSLDDVYGNGRRAVDPQERVRVLREQLHMAQQELNEKQMAHGYPPRSPQVSYHYSRNQGYQRQSDLYSHHSGSSAGGIKGGGIFGLPTSQEEEHPKSPSIKSDEKKKKAHAKAAMAKSFIQF